MPFKVVQTIEGKKCKLFTVPSGWENDSILRYPNKCVSKLLKDENSKPTPDWDVMKCKVKRKNLSSYEIGDNFVTEMMKYSDTEEENQSSTQQRRPQNKKQINLNSMAENMVGNVLLPNFNPDITTSTGSTVIEFDYNQEPQANSTQNASQVLLNRRPQNKKQINLKPMAENMIGNVLLTKFNPDIPSTSADSVIELDDNQEPQANATQNASQVLLNDTPITIIEDSLNFDINKMFENQKNIMENQSVALSQILRIQQVQIDNNVALTTQIKDLNKIQNHLVQKVSSLSVQLEDAVTQLVTASSSQEVLSDNIQNPINFKKVDSIQDLDELERQLVIPTICDRLKSSLSVLCSGGKGLDCAYLLVDIMFTRKFICACSWGGGSRGDELKIPIKGYKHTLSFFWNMIHCWDEKYSMKDNEMFFKTILKNSKKRNVALNKRASTSRSTNKTKKVKMSEDGMSLENDLADINTDEKKTVEQTMEEKNDTKVENRKKDTKKETDEENHLQENNDIGIETSV